MNKIEHPKNPKWIGLFNGRKSSETRKSEYCESGIELIKHLLFNSRIVFLEWDRLEAAGVSIESHALEGQSLHQTALDLIGVPSEGAIINIRNEHHVYSRDWTEEPYREIVVEHEDYDEYIGLIRTQAMLAGRKLVS